jgi:hypothetical protein
LGKVAPEPFSVTAATAELINESENAAAANVSIKARRQRAVKKIIFLLLK